VGDMGHVVHSGASGTQTSAHYFSFSGRPGADPTKSASEHITPNLCFLHLVGSTDHVVRSGTPGA
jgi:hypothetical protein